MPTFEFWKPGPTVNEEYETIQGLMAAFRDQCFGNFSTQTILGNPSGWILDAWTYHSNAGKPYIKAAWEEESGSDLVWYKFRFDLVLKGMLDPYTYLLPTLAGMDGIDQANFQRAYDYNTGAPQIAGFLGALRAAELVGGTFDTFGESPLLYEKGPNEGKIYGRIMTVTYVPTDPEFQGGVGKLPHTLQFHTMAPDGDDGTLSFVAAPVEIGVSHSQVPYMIGSTPDHGTAWDAWKDSLDEVKDEIANTLPKLTDIADAGPGLSVMGAPDTVTHPDDVGEPGDPAEPPPVPGQAVFSAPGAASGAVASPGTSLVVSTTVGAMTLAYQLVAYVAAQVGNLGLVAAAGTAMAAASAWLPSLGSISTSVANAATKLGELATEGPLQTTELQNQDATLARIADALEAIQAELVGDPNDQAVDPGIVTATEQAAQTRTKLDVQTRGHRFSAESGGCWEE